MRQSHLKVCAIKSFLVTSAFAAMGVLFPISRAAATVVGGPVTDSGHTYYLVSKNTRTNAEAEAQTLGGHLVTINDAIENTFIINTFVLNGHVNDPLWIGITDVAVEGTFVWSSGEPVTYTNWHVTEPNDGNGAEDYAAINWYFAFTGSSHETWNDTPDAGTTGYGVNTDGPYFGVVEVVPEPASLGLVALGGFALIRKARLHKSQSR